MRISQVYFLMMTSAMIAVASPPGIGQSIETTVVSLEITNEPLRKVFQKIESQTDFLFAWNKKVNEYGRVTLAKGNYTVKNVLDIVLKGTGLKYEQDEKYILVTPVGKSESVVKEGEVENGGGGVEVYTPALVTGTVRDAATQEPLAGVNIIVKGTSKGTTTDVEGKFGIEAEEDDVLVFSFIGFQTFETQVAGRSVIEVAMDVDVTALKEVEINAGYWNVKDREKTGNISKITSEDISNQNVTNPLQALQGRMPGVYVQQDSGIPGGGFNIKIRGQNSLRVGGNNPLYIVDGVPFTATSIQSDVGNTIIQGSPDTGSGVSPFNSINPMDIESIEVLKDADATAIYGSRGANGVVLITTKRGKSGTAKVDVNVSTGFGQVAHKIDLLNTSQYLEMRTEAFRNDGIILADITESDPRYWSNVDLLAWDTTRYTDWQKELIGGTAHKTMANISFAGGNRNVQFLLGGGYNTETTVFPGNFGYRRGSTHLNLNYSSINGKLKVSLTNNYVIDENNQPTEDLTSYALRLSPNAPEPFDENGNLNFENSTWFAPAPNPYSLIKKKYTANTSKFLTNVVVGYEILNGLKLKSNLGFTSLETEETSTRPFSSMDPAFPTTRSSSFGNGSLKTWIAEPQIDYQKNIARGTLNVLFGATFQQNIQQSQRLTGSGYSSDALLLNIQAAPTVRINKNTYSQYRYQAFFGRINYNFQGKYILNLTGRRDGSSRFGEGKQFANFGAIGAAWIFSSEQFVKNTWRFLSFGKIRASYGTTGSDQIPNYGYLDSYSPTVPYQGSSLVPTRLANPEFGWEINKKIEAALELGIADDKISLEASWYKNQSSNQLVGQSLPAISGFTTFQSNFPASVENTGWEFVFTTKNIKSDNFSWATSLNMTIPRNKLISYPGIESSDFRNTHVVGESIFTRKMNKYIGVDPIIGIIKFDDVNGDSVINDEDRSSLTRIGQSFYGGIQNSIIYKGWKLDIFFQFVRQKARSYMGAFSAPGVMGNQPNIVMNRWRNEGDISNIQRFTATGSEAASAYYFSTESGDNNIVDASFIRLQNIALSWTIPSTWIRKIQVDNIGIYAQGQNLFTITNYLGFDPQNSNSTILPPLRLISIGLQITL